MSDARSFGPTLRSPAALRMTRAAALGRFELQECERCGCVQYPPREACQRCLSVALSWRTQSGRAELLSHTTLFHSHDAYFSQRLPWRVGLARLDNGPVVIAHLHAAVTQAPARVRVVVRLDRTGHAALVAVPEAAEVSLVEDRQLNELSWDVKGRRVLVTDATSPQGAALIGRLLEHGAGAVWAGVPPGAAAA
jgi:uncharacterized OB-fold protein